MRKARRLLATPCRLGGGPGLLTWFREVEGIARLSSFAAVDSFSYRSGNWLDFSTAILNQQEEGKMYKTAHFIILVTDKAFPEKWNNIASGSP
ncbi:MAG TPA: hypothetical protein VN875_10325 [Candidatus Binatus sp.]|nr:hypothetical protein [Candidatus Binatus sp.]